MKVTQLAQAEILAEEGSNNEGRCEVGSRWGAKSIKVAAVYRTRSPRKCAIKPICKK